MNTNIVDLSIDLLEHHPKNPRQDLGDLTELADSIREKGILQNLTVVPNDHCTYYVVIGNRRLEAAKMAGLESLPCVISPMKEDEQQAVMLLENMQRNDLDPYEQAHGFQMCLDLGMTEDDLKKQTGFSKKTIRHRLNLLKLDHDKFKESVQRGATLQDYIDLEQIEDEKTRDEVLEVIGTDGFRYKLRIELARQEDKKLFSNVLESLKSQGVEEVDKGPEGYGLSKALYGKSDFNDFLKSEPLKDPDKYCFTDYEGFYIYLYKKSENNTEEKNVTPTTKEPTEEEKAESEIILKADAAYQTRLEFVKEKMETLHADIKILFDLSSVYISIKEELIETSYRVNFDENFEGITGNSVENGIKKPENVKETIRLLFALIYSNFELNDSSDLLEPSWRGERPNAYRSDQKEPLESYYQWLESFGYVASEEEKQIMFGTHPLYEVKNGK